MKIHYTYAPQPCFDGSKLTACNRVLPAEHTTQKDSEVTCMRCLWERERGAKAAREAYSKLVDKKFAVGLTPAEERKVAALDDRLNEADEKFYAPIMAKLKAEMRRLGLKED